MKLFIFEVNSYKTITVHKPNRMNLKVFLVLFLAIIINSEGLTQIISDAQKKEITDEGIELFKLEKAGMLATEIVLDTLSIEEKMEIADFLCYNSDGNYKSIYWKNKGKYAIICETLSFSNTIDKNKFTFEKEERLPTSYEIFLIRVKQRVLEEMKADPSFFRVKNSDNYHFLFYLDKSKKMKVYIIAIIEHDDKIYLGSDFLLTFKPNGKLITKMKIHDSSIRLPAKMIVNEEAKIQGTVHLHSMENSALINPTDICLLLLNAPNVNWNKHYVMSDEFVSIFDIRSKKLNVLPSSFFEE